MLRELGEETGVTSRPSSKSSHQPRGGAVLRPARRTAGQAMGRQVRASGRSGIWSASPASDERYRPRGAQAARILRMEMGRARSAARADRAVQARRSTQTIVGSGFKAQRSDASRPAQFCVTSVVRRDGLGGQHRRGPRSIAAASCTRFHAVSPHRLSSRRKVFARLRRARPSPPAPRPRPKSRRGCRGSRSSASR